jgi:hypothetical protein
MAKVIALFEYENRRHGVSDFSPLNKVRITLLGSCVNAAFGSASATGCLHCESGGMESRSVVRKGDD